MIRKLTDNEVRTIRVRSAGGATGQVLAKEYGVSTTTISDILTNRIYRDKTYCIPELRDIAELTYIYAKYGRNHSIDEIQDLLEERFGND